MPCPPSSADPPPIGRSQSGPAIEGSPDPQRRLRIASLVRSLVSLGLLAALVSAVDPVRMLHMLAGLDGSMLALSLLAGVLQAPLSSVRLGILLEARGWRFAPWALLRLTFVSNFLGTFLPSGVGSDLVRAGALAATRIPARYGLAAVAADRLCGGLGLALGALLAGVSALVWRGRPQALGWSLLPAGAVLVLCFLAFSRPAWRLALMVYRRVPRLPGRVALRRVHHQVASFREHPGALSQAVGLSLVVQILRVVSFWACARAMHLPVALAPCAEAVLPATLVSMVPISVGGWGVREGILVLLLPLSSGEALGLALVHRVILLASNLPGACWFGGRGLGVEVRQGPVPDVRIPST